MLIRIFVLLPSLCLHYLMFILCLQHYESEQLNKSINQQIFQLTNFVLFCFLEERRRNKKNAERTRSNTIIITFKPFSYMRSTRFIHFETQAGRFNNIWVSYLFWSVRKHVFFTEKNIEYIFYWILIYSYYNCLNTTKLNFSKMK